MVTGELAALLDTKTLPVALPAAAGVKVTFKVALCPGVRICSVDAPLAVKSAQETLTFEIVTLELPVIVRVTGRVLLLPMFTFPKVKLVGFALSRKVVALTVRVAPWLITVATRLLTTMLNWAPFSDVVSEGVV
jgi:hypothetical protein